MTCSQFITNLSVAYTIQREKIKKKKMKEFRKSAPPLAESPSETPVESAGESAPAVQEWAFAKICVQKAFPSKNLDGTFLLEPFAELDYTNELKIKNESLAAFWSRHRLEGTPEPIIASPRPRKYRTTTTRRVMYRSGRCTLGFTGEKIVSKKNFTPSLLEPDEHSTLYDLMASKLNEPSYRAVAEALNFLIIRGSYDERAVIYNMALLNAETVRKLKLLTDHLRNADSKLLSGFIFQDPTRSAYYFEQKRTGVSVQFKKLFGSEKLFLKVPGKKFSYHPTAFSQVNESVVPEMITVVKNYLSAPPAMRLLDLYCGYGLFGLSLGENYADVFGMDAEGVSIQSGVENSAFIKTGARIKFVAGRITEESLQKRLPPVKGDEHILLDPPRQGTAEGVIETLAARQPEKVVHIFCGVDEIPRELALWKKSGYTPEKIQPLDMFAGTPNLETVVLLSRKAAGK
jgi:tRNA/tmRNA/rRNA uracil-C5-methylase (TrmA/RlmC/RlmD family)